MWSTDRVAGVALAVVGAGAFGQSLRLPLGSLRDPGPGYAPTALALALAGLGVLIAAGGARAAPLAARGWTEWRHAAAILGACAFAALALERLGYRLTVVGLLLFLLRGVERKGWLLAGGVALGLGAGSFYLFDTLLRVPLPRGPFGV